MSFLLCLLLHFLSSIGNSTSNEFGKAAHGGNEHTLFLWLLHNLFLLFLFIGGVCREGILDQFLLFLELFEGNALLDLKVALKLLQNE